MKSMRSIVALLGVLSVVVGICAADDAPSQNAKTVRLLTIGNSFSQNATRYLPDLAATGSHTLIHRPVVVGGAPLQLHADKAAKHEQDPRDPEGLYANGRSLRQELAAEPWDYVTIQQASIKSHDLSTYQPYASRLAAYVAEFAPSAKLLVHETWAYRCDDPRFAVASPKPGEPATQEAMYNGLAHAYRTVAVELAARLIPVGDAFYRADHDPQWGYRPDTRFDPKTAHAPTLPDQTHSLHVGWRWLTQKDGGPKLAMDGHHANVAGEYLGACVFYEVLFGDSVVGNSFVPAGVAPAYARFLQETAHEVAANQEMTNRARPRSADSKAPSEVQHVPALQP